MQMYLIQYFIYTFLKIENIREDDYPWVLILLLQMIQEYLFAGWMNFVDY